MRHGRTPGGLDAWKAGIDTQVGLACPGEAANLYELGEPGIGYRVSAHQSCFYHLGNHFLSSLLLTLGEEVTSAALADVFQLIRSEEEGRPLTAKDIYLAFQRNIRPNQQAEFRNLFSRLHGGPLTDADPNAPEDHGDNRATATRVTVDTTVQGALEDALDTDYFRFTAEAGDSFNIVLNHGVFFDNAADREAFANLYVRLHRPDGRPAQSLEQEDRLTSTLQVEWTAPVTGEYYLSVESPHGVAGTYDLRLSRSPRQN